MMDNKKSLIPVDANAVNKKVAFKEGNMDNTGKINMPEEGDPTEKKKVSKMPSPAKKSSNV